MELGVMELVMILQAFLYFCALVVGFAVMWGKIRQIAEDHERRIAAQENRLVQSDGSTAYVTPDQCKEHRDDCRGHQNTRDRQIKALQDSIQEVQSKVGKMGNDISAIKTRIQVNTNGIRSDT